MNEESKTLFQPPLNFLCLYQGLYIVLARAVSARALKPSPAQAISHPSSAQGGGEAGTTPLAVSPLIELELRGKNECVARRETKGLIYKLKVLVCYP